MRIFLAIEIPERIKKDLVRIQKELKPQLPGVRWEKAEKFHITLVFLGRVPGERVEELKAVVQEALLSARQGPFKIGFSKVGFFPKKRPRVVLLEVGEGREEIEKLQGKLANSLSEAGFSFARLSKPHVTLGRLKNGGVQGLSLDTVFVGGFWVGEIAIVESKLHPAGSIYTTLFRVSLVHKNLRP